MNQKDSPKGGNTEAVADSNASRQAEIERLDREDRLRCAARIDRDPARAHEHRLRCAARISDRHERAGLSQSVAGPAGSGLSPEAKRNDPNDNYAMYEKDRLMKIAAQTLGSAKSKAKARASRENGRKGGRPKLEEGEWDDIGIGEKFVFNSDREQIKTKISNASYYSCGEGKAHRITKRWRNRCLPL